MTIPADRLHDISDHVWQLLVPHLLGKKGDWGRDARDNRLFIFAFFGSFAPARHGKTCHLTMVTGKILTAFFAVGVIKGPGLVFKSD